jgi:hypothetical protein
VVIVGHVEAIEPLVGPPRAVGPVGRDGPVVGLGRLSPADAAHVAVRGYVHQVGQPGLEAAEPIRGDVGRLGMRRRLDDVDVEVAGERVVRGPGQDGLQGRQDLRGGPSGAQRSHGRKSISASAYCAPTSGSSGYASRAARIASA